MPDAIEPFVRRCAGDGQDALVQAHLRARGQAEARVESALHIRLVEGKIIFPLEIDPGRIDPGGARHRGGIGRGGITQTGDLRFPEPMVLRPGDDDPGVRLQLPNESGPVPMIEREGHQAGGHESGGEDEEEPGAGRPALAFFLGILRAQAVLELGAERPENRRIAVEVREGRTFQRVDAVDRILERGPQFARRISADHRREVSQAPGRDPDLEIAHAELVEVRIFAGLKGIAREILNRAKHTGNHVRVAAERGIGGGMEKRETGRAMNEKDLLDPVDETAQHHHFGKALARAQSLETPLQTAPGKGVLERLIE